MNKDINKTLMALVPILRMNGENVTNIEAVHDWYKDGDREYMKEVAEITYDNGTVRYADIGCDSNLTAIYDVIAVIQQIKPKSEAIERIERGVYSLPPAQPEITLESAIDYLHSIGWMQEHDRILTESAQPERDTPKRVLWTGWKGCRYTRYNCPNCKKPVRNDDVYCHRCGQKLMFPKVSHTPYVEGQKQEVIVRWDDE